jgi:hypothetical protein
MKQIDITYECANYLYYLCLLKSCTEWTEAPIEETYEDVVNLLR